MLVCEIKICSNCKKELQLDSFYKDKRKRDGLSSSCKYCSDERVAKWIQNNSEKRKLHLKKYYKGHKDHIFNRQLSYRKTEQWMKSHRNNIWQFRGIKNLDGSRFSWGDYEIMLNNQLGKCAICFVDTPGGNRKWHVDHDHKTGFVRWILCPPCNIGIGNFKDSPELLRKAASMLESKNASI